MTVYVASLPTGMTVFGRAEEIGEHTWRFTKPYLVQFMAHPQQPDKVMPQAMPYAIIPGVTQARDTLVLRPGQYVDVEAADAQLEALYSKVAFGLEIPKSGIQLATR